MSRPPASGNGEIATRFTRQFLYFLPKKENDDGPHRRDLSAVGRIPIIVLQQHDSTFERGAIPALRVVSQGDNLDLGAPRVAEASGSHPGCSRRQESGFGADATGRCHLAGTGQALAGPSLRIRSAGAVPQHSSVRLSCSRRHAG